MTSSKFASAKLIDFDQIPIVDISAIETDKGFLQIAEKLVETAKEKNSKWQKSIRINCDCLLISAGWSPVIHLAAPHSEKPVWSHEQACFLPGKNNQDIIFVGSAAGIWNTLNCEKSGNILNENKLNQKSEKNSVLPLFQTPINNNKSKNFVDFQQQ